MLKKLLYMFVAMSLMSCLPAEDEDDSNNYQLTITLSEAGYRGTVTAELNNILCGESCTVEVLKESSVTLTASPISGYVFSGWGGACEGNGHCVVSMSSNKAITASFDLALSACDSSAILADGHFDSEFSYNAATSGEDNSETLLTTFVVKGTSSYGATGQPVSMIFPLPSGEYFHAGDFHLKNSEGEHVSAQFNVINRWWGQDRSLRHLQVHFIANISAYESGQSDTGVETFQLFTGKNNSQHENSICVAETEDLILLDNSVIDIQITKSPLSIITPAGALKSVFIKENGESDFSFEHENISIELEEVGPVRSIVKISSLTNYVSPTEIKHGWVIRLYMYANSDKVKVDFQLQNSALNTLYSAPLYFKSHRLFLEESGSNDAATLQASYIDGENISSGLAGVISSPKVNVFFKDFWQKFPQGLAKTANGEVSIELWPNWSNQFYDADFADLDMYWLDDMRQVYKEILFDFSQRADSDYLNQVAANFQYEPIAVLPQIYYQQTQVTVELGGYFPLTAISSEKNRVPQYSTTDFTEPYYSGQYKFSLDNFGLDLPRKRATSMAGGWPYSKKHFFVSGDPQSYYAAQIAANAELNIRPQWLSGYTHEKDFSFINPTANPYGGSTWRDFLGHGVSTTTRDYIEGSSKVAYPRDDQHAWFYHVEQAYLMSGNKWIKDWYQFMGEFKKVYLQGLDPFPDRSNRAEGHSVSVALSAYRITGNEGLGELLSDYIVDAHTPYLLAPHNISVGKLTSTDPKSATFQLGYLMKPFIELMYEFPEQEATLAVIKSAVDWNHYYANYSYYKSVLDSEVNTTGSGTGLSFVDVAIWYALYSGDKSYAVHAINYVTLGIGGVKPYGNWGEWIGQYEAQLYNYYLQQ